MLTGLHFLLSYKCNSECDHCFVYSSPWAEGTFTLRQVRRLLDEAVKLGTVEWIYFEGGEPFLFYPIMLAGIETARNLGFQVGVVSNGYFATDEDDIKLWLKPLAELGIGDLSISNDTYHYEDDKHNPAVLARKVARKLKLPVAEIHIDAPSVTAGAGRNKGEPIIGGSTKFVGRAAEKLIDDLPRRSWDTFTACTQEDLESPQRVHLDAYGNVHICQGLSMGNAWETPLADLVRNYDPAAHPICGPLLRGGPAQLAREYRLDHDDGYVDACHCCYLLRRALLDKFPRYLAPRQVYGLE